MTSDERLEALREDIEAYPDVDSGIALELIDAFRRERDEAWATGHQRAREECADILGIEPGCPNSWRANLRAIAFWVRQNRGLAGPEMPR